MAVATGLLLAESGTGDELAWRLHGRPPHLLPIGGRTPLERALDAFSACGIAQAVVAVSPRSAEAVIECVEARRPDDLAVRYLERRNRTGVADTVLEARTLTAGEPLLVHAADAMVGEDLSPILDDFRRRSSDVLLITAPAPVPAVVGAGGPARASDADDLVRMQCPAPAAIFGAAALQALDKLGSASTAGADLGTTVAALAASGSAVRCRVAEDAWFYRDDCTHILAGNTLALDGLTSTSCEGQVIDAQIGRRVLVHPTATIVRSVVRGPAVIGPGTEVIDAYIGPYSAIGAGVVVEGAEIEHSVVLANAVVRQPGRRIESSLIGEGAHVTRAFTLPAGLRLCIGHEAHVVLAS